jgi:hypothetical protein
MMSRVRRSELRGPASLGGVAALVSAVFLSSLGGCDKFLGSDGDTEAAAGSDAVAAAEATPAPADADAGKKKKKKKKKKKTKADDGETADAGAGGPRVAWQTDFTTAPRTLTISDSGTLVVVFEAEAKGYLDGAQVWAKEGSYTGPVTLQDGTLVTSIGGVVTGFDPASGQQTFEVSIPAPAPTGKRDRDKPPPAVVSVAPFGSQLSVAMADARFFVIDPPTCAKEEPACLRPAGALEGEYLEPTAYLAVADDGTRLLVEDEGMRAFDIALAEVFSLEASANIVGAVAIPGGKLAVSFGGETALLSLASCAGGAVRLSRGTTAPKGCVQWRYGQGLDRVPPGVIDAETLAVNGNQRLQAVINGTDSWKSPIGAVGPVVGEADQVLTIALAKSDADIKLSVKSVDSKMGTINWTVPLPFALAADTVLDPSQLRLHKRGDWIVAAYGEHTAVLSQG